jgi:hypothetical protein
MNDLLPQLYHSDGNEISGFVEQLEPEIINLERKIDEITALVDVDRCPAEYLPYLASLTNAPLIGDNPVLWRRQIRNWPWLLKFKGTEKSLALFLNSVGAQDYKLYTWFRDADGEYVEEKPDGEPFFDENTGLWRNIRTHYFSVDMVIENQLIENQVWSMEEIKRRILPWFERTKPFHAELLRFTIGPPDREYTSPLYLGTAIAEVTSSSITPERPQVNPSPIIAGLTVYSSGLESVGLSRPEIKPTRAFTGIVAITVKTTQYGTLSEPRPVFEVWPQYLSAGIIGWSQRKSTVGPSVPFVAGRFSVGLGTVTTKYSTIRQEAY